MANEDTLPDGLEGIDLGKFEEMFKDGIEETPPVQAPEAEQPGEPESKEQETADEWVHEPTGKKFKSEAEYLRYDSGYNNQKYGEQLKALRAEIEQIKGGKSATEAETTKPRSEADIRDELVGEFMQSRVPENLRNDETLGLVRDMMFEMIKQYDSRYASPQFSKVAEMLKETQSGLQVQSLRAKMGVSPEVEAEILQKHEFLQKLEPQERMAVIADLAKGATAQSRDSTSRRLADKIPQPRAEDHVEGSAKSSPPEGEGAGFESWLSNFDKKDVDSQESTLTKMIQEAGRRGELDLY